MKTLLLLDTETTGLDPAKERVIEVAVARYDIEHATVVESFASLITAPDNDAEHINRIPAGFLPGAPEARPVWERVQELALRSDVIVAHRVEFDRAFVNAALAALELSTVGLADADGKAIPWVCSKFDIDWPRQDKPGASLVMLALALDLGVAYAHRAMADVDLVARVFTRVKELGGDLPALIQRGLRPKSKIISLAPFEQKDVVKKNGFAWDPDGKIWWRNMVPEDATTLPFKYRIESLGGR